MTDPIDSDFVWSETQVPSRYEHIQHFLEKLGIYACQCLQRRAEDPNFKYKPWMDRPDE